MAYKGDNKTSYVYLHRRNDTGEIFYVGVGSKNRAYRYGRNIHWNRIASKYGYSVEVVYKTKDRESAFELEKFIISTLGRHNTSEGNLCNMTEGGEGVIGCPSSESKKEKLRNRTVPQEVREKISKALKGKCYRELKPFSEEHKAKLKEARNKRPPITKETRKKLSDAGKRSWAKRKKQ